MHDAHESSGVLVLPDDRVLVVGGHRIQKGWTLVETVELYDPTADVWTKTAPLLEAREGVGRLHLLGNGRVLVSGEHNTMTGCELFDPAKGQWTATGALNVGRGSHISELLDDGRVFVAGGINWGEVGTPSFDSAELYDPASGSWRLTTAMGRRRMGATSVTLTDGTVLVLGGYEDANTPDFFRHGEIYDPASSTWRTTAEASRGIGNAGVVRLKDGRVLVAGGMARSGGQGDSHKEAEIYDPLTDSWAPTGSMATARSQFPLLPLDDGRVIAVGGVLRPEGRALGEAEIYDPETGTWSGAGRMAVPRWNHRVVRIPQGVLAVGGYNASGQLSSVELLDRL
jgi:N-acetylneuraminic acid mutarotase